MHTRGRTSIHQKFPANFEQKLTQQHVIQLRKKH